MGDTYLVVSRDIVCVMNDVQGIYCAVGKCNCRCFLFQAEDGIRDLVRSRGLGDVYKRQYWRIDLV